MIQTTLTGVLAIALLVGGCGGGETGERAAGPTPAASATAPSGGAAETGYTRKQVIEALGVTPGRDRNGVPNSDLRTGCFAKKIFVTPEDNMAAYVQIGDPVATNPAGAVGVFVGTYSGVSADKCLRVFERRLAELG